MKPQDIAFLALFLLLLFLKNARLAAIIGIISLFIAIPLFSGWIFFTAQRLVMYGAGFFSLTIVFSLWSHNTVE